MPEGYDVRIMQERWNPGFDFKLTWYLAGPMSGYPEYNYPAFTEAARILRATGITLRTPHETPWPVNHEAMSEGELWRYMMEATAVVMGECNGIILMKGWPQSRGAKAELDVALMRSWPVWFYHDYFMTNMNKDED